MKVFLSPRLKTIASKVEKGARIIDVGTDHAYVPLYLLKENIASAAIATDINKEPLERAAGNIALYGFKNKIKTVLTNGVMGIDEKDYDTVIVAGMGGMLVSEIISSISDKKRLILQPMTAVAELRKYLYTNSYQILDEELVQEEDKIYVIIVAEKGSTQSHSITDIYVGKKILENKDPLAALYIEKQKNKIETIINGMQMGKKTDGGLLLKYETLLALLKKL